MLGGIVSAAWEPGQYGEQLHITIDALDYEVKGQTGYLHEWYVYTTQKNSKYGKFLEAIESLGITLKDIKELVGQVFFWQRKEFEFGDGIKSKPTWIPTALPESVKKERQAKVTETPQQPPQEMQEPPRRRTPKEGAPSFEQYRRKKEQ